MPETKVERTHYRSGQIRQELPYCDGQLHGTVRTWHKSGVLALEEPYVEGRLHGVCRQWSEDGKLLGSYKMVQGSGVRKKWHDNGQISLETTIAEGEFKGRTRTWLRDGTLVFEESLSEGDTTQNQRSRSAVLVDVGAAKSGSAHRAVASKKGPDLDSQEHGLFVQGLLEKPNHAEARKWLEETSPHPGRRLLGHFGSQAQASQFIEELYATGAVSVVAADLYSNARDDQFCDRLLVQLPSDKAKRNGIRQMCQRLCATSKAAFQPDHDIGETHLYLLLD